MPTFTDCLHIYLQVDRSPSTNQQYQVVLAPLVAALGPQRDITLIRYEDLLDYLSRLRPQIRPTTLASYTSVVKAFFNWCVQRRYIERSPAADIVRRQPDRDPRSRAVPQDELLRMVEYARVTSPRNYALLLFLIDTGCRVGGLVSLTLDNLDLNEMAAWLTEKGGVWHRAYFGETTAAALRVWLGKRPTVSHESVWTGPGPTHTPLTAKGVAFVVRRMAERTDASRKWGPHSIRHAVGHAYARAGLPVTITQAKLGHSTPTITLSHYYPDHDDYLRQVSRRHELLALAPDEAAPPKPTLVRKTGNQ